MLGRPIFAAIDNLKGSVCLKDFHPHIFSSFIYFNFGDSSCFSIDLASLTIGRLDQNRS
jgi:hypothetical protein